MIATYLYMKRKAKKEAEHGNATDRPAGPHLLSKNPPSKDFTSFSAPNESDSNKERSHVELNSLTKEAEKHEKSKSRMRTIRLVTGLFFPYFIASTDITSKTPDILLAFF